jgi:hypothetical protein
MKVFFFFMRRAIKVEQELMRGIRDDELQVARF